VKKRTIEENLFYRTIYGHDSVSVEFEPFENHDYFSEDLDNLKELILKVELNKDKYEMFKYINGVLIGTRRETDEEVAIRYAGYKEIEEKRKKTLELNKAKKELEESQRLENEKKKQEVLSKLSLEDRKALGY
jgi:hypothetical protein